MKYKYIATNNEYNLLITKYNVAQDHLQQKAEYRLGVIEKYQQLNKNFNEYKIKYLQYTKEEAQRKKKYVYEK